MAIYAIGDLHLSYGVPKPMDIFGGWKDYMKRIEENWRRKITPQDTVVLSGDTSWGMSLEEALADFEFLQSLPGQKILLKGNHDYWWTTARKMRSFFDAHGLNSLEILNNNAVVAQGMAICGSRGWLFETGDPQDDKIIAREALRLGMSLEKGKETGLPVLCFLHYPPVYGECISGPIIDVMLQYGVTRCFYGHLHAQACAWALNGSYLGIDFQLISSDFLKFNPMKIEK